MNHALKPEETDMLLAVKKPLKERRGERRMRDQKGGAPFARMVDGQPVMVDECERNQARRQVLPSAEPRLEHCDYCEGSFLHDEAGCRMCRMQGRDPLLGWHPEPDYVPTWKRQVRHG